MNAPENEWARLIGGDQKQFNTLFDRMMDGFAYHKIILDMDSKPVDFVFLNVNSAFEQLTGLKREAIIGRKATEVIPGLENDAADWIGIYGKVAMGGESVQFENYAKPLDRWYRVNAYCPAKGYFVALFEDITARKKAEKQVVEQALMLENANDAIVGYGLDQKITFWNKAAEELYGYTSEEALGQMGLDLLKPVYVNTKREKLIDRLMSEGRTEFESARQTKDGRSVDIEAHVILLRDGAGKPIGYVSVDRDITERKQMLEKLEEYAKNLEGLVEERTKEVTTERQRLYNVLETIPAYVILLDKNYKVSFANRMFRERFGQDHGRRCYDFLFNRDSPCENCETYKVLKTNGPHHWEWTGPDNRNYDIFDFPFTEADGSTLVLEMGIDITERKKAEQTVKAASLYTRSLIEASLDPLVTISAEGKVTDVNEATIHSTGCSRDELIGSDFSDYFTEPEKARAGYQQVFAKGYVRDYPLAIRHKSGIVTDVLYNATVYKNEAGEIQGVFAAARDITQQKTFEEKLRAISLYSRSLIEAALDPLVTINSNGKITDVNEATIAATGCSRNELIGSDFCEYFTEPDRAREGYEKVFTYGHVIDYPLTLLHRSGRTTDVLYNASVYRNEKGEVQGVFAAARDVTELNRYREHLEELVEERTKALRESQEKLEVKAAEVEEYATNMEALAEERALKLKDAERLAAIGATAGMVGHDIRNPLQAIIGDIFLAQSDVTSLPPSETKDSLIESLYSIQKSVDYVNKIVQDLQDYAKPIGPSVCDTDLNSIIEDVIRRNSIPENITLQRRLAEDARRIRVDPDLLRRIVGNLVSNAVQAMPEGGKLIIRAHMKNNDAIIAVKDTGQGIPEAARANLFTPLFTTKSKGQGFGLAVVKRLTEAMGGTVTFESEVGKGAEFIITLPQ